MEIGYYALAHGLAAGESGVVLPLDKVDDGLAGCLAWRDLKRVAESRGVTFMADGTKWLSDSSLYHQASLLASGAEPLATAEKYKEHLQQLESFKICKRLGNGRDAAATCRYFAVPKNTEHARSILDCSRMSEPIRKDVGPVNLATIPDILRRLQDQVRRNEKPAILLSDLRHFFHQLKLDDQVQLFFLVRVNDEIGYQWLVLPMGHTVSPKVAQTIAHGLLAMAIGRAPKGSALPHYQFFDGGIATIFYDNLIAGGETKEVEQLANKWNHVCEKFHAVVKYTRCFKGHALGMQELPAEREDDQRPVMLGVRVAITRGGTKGSRENLLSYRHSAANVQRLGGPRDQYQA